MPRLAWLLLSCVALFGVLLLSPGLADTPKGKKYALLVGVKTYQRSGHFPDLKYCENDVEKLADLLGKRAGFAVRLLTTSRGEKAATDAPTPANVRAALAALVEDRGPADTLLVALSGHGVQVEVEDPDGKDTSRTYGYFCPSDADLVNVSYSTGRSKTLLNVTEVFNGLGRSGAGVKVVLMDACRNELKADSATRSLDVESVRIPRGVGAVFSCSSGQRAFETAKLEHGVFFHFVLKGLGGEAKNSRGEVTLSRLAEYVTERVEEEVPSLIGSGARQTPHPIVNIPGRSPVLLGPVAAAATAGKEEVVKEKSPGKEVVVKGEKEFVNAIGMKLVRIPAGKFTMGSPRDEEDREPRDKGSEKQHEVEITKGFYLGVYEVTQKQFRDVMGYNPSSFAADGEGKEGLEYQVFSKPAGSKTRVAGEETDDFPVENVSWEEAVAFCQKLNEKADEKKPAGYVYRLPREAEWEYSCRAGSSSYKTFYFGNSLSSSQANFNGNFPYGGADKGEFLDRTCKVDSSKYKPNAFGLYHMHGNVWEWQSDWYDKDYYATSPRRDPGGPSEGSSRVVRGGGWGYPGQRCRSAVRYGFAPAFRNRGFGFRVALVSSGGE